MNKLFEQMANAPSVKTDRFKPHCVICGCVSRPIEAHHVIPRSHGGTNGPTLDVCSAGGNNIRGYDGGITCHGAIHHHLLHVRWTGDRWEYLRTAEPTKYERALEMKGWKPLRHMDIEEIDSPF